jgi:hypothetical protein
LNPATAHERCAAFSHGEVQSRWIQTVDDKVTLAKTADEARDHWRDEERSGALGWGADRSAEARARSFNY